jgi:hypothetical protein
MHVLVFGRKKSSRELSILASHMSYIILYHLNGQTNLAADEEVATPLDKKIAYV